MAILRSRFILASLALALLLTFAVSCGNKTVDVVENGDENFEVRVAVTSALELDRALDLKAGESIQMVKNGQYNLDQGMEILMDQNKSLLDLIGEVSAPGNPPDPTLARARRATEEYLRGRVHQLESAIAATTPDELVSYYESGSAELDNKLRDVVDLLLEYDPGLEEEMRQVVP